MEVTDRIASLEQRVQMQEDEIQLLKSALADVVRRLNVSEEQQAMGSRRGPTKGSQALFLSPLPFLSFLATLGLSAACFSLRPPPPRLLSSPVLSPAGALSVGCVVRRCVVVPALMRKSTSADGSVGKSGRPAVTCGDHRALFLFPVDKEHIPQGHCPPPLLSRARWSHCAGSSCICSAPPEVDALRVEWEDRSRMLCFV